MHGCVSSECVQTDRGKGCRACTCCWFETPPPPCVYRRGYSVSTFCTLCACPLGGRQFGSDRHSGWLVKQLLLHQAGICACVSRGSSLALVRNEHVGQPAMIVLLIAAGRHWMHAMQAYAYSSWCLVGVLRLSAVLWVAWPCDRNTQHQELLRMLQLPANASIEGSGSGRGLRYRLSSSSAACPAACC